MASGASRFYLGLDLHKIRKMNARTRDQRQGENFLANRPLLSLLLIIFVVMLGQFWYQGVLGFVQSFFDEEPPWYLLILIAIVLTTAFYLLVRYFFKLPLSIFT